MTTVVSMPIGLPMPLTGVRHTVTLSAAVGLAGGLLLGGAGPAQATHLPEGAESIADPFASYPAPGQPIVTPRVDESENAEHTTVEKAPGDVRIATLRAGLTGESTEAVVDALRGGANSSARVVAETAHLNDPDVLVLTGITHDEDGVIADMFNTRYLAPAGLDYPYVYTAPTNSGIDSGADLDGDGRIGGPGDALGYGEYPGQHGMAVFSAHPIVEDEVRTFQNFLWKDLPGNALPDGDYSDLEKSVLRLSGTSLWDIPVEIEDTEETLHVIANAQPPEDLARSFDADRTTDERRMIADYVSTDPSDGWYIYDDSGQTGGLTPGSSFIISGEPGDAAETDGAADEGPDQTSDELLLDSAALQDPLPEAITELSLSSRSNSEEGTDEHATRAVHGDADRRTSFILPDAAAEVTDAGVFWPGEGEYGFHLIDPEEGAALSDRLVWVDLSTS